MLSCIRFFVFITIFSGLFDVVKEINDLQKIKSFAIRAVCLLSHLGINKLSIFRRPADE
jgi:hypothetical protein